MVKEKEYAIHRLWTFLDELESLKGSEFPYPHPLEGLERIENHFREHLLKWLITADSATNKELIQQHCSEALENIYAHLPTLGFILRSTNVRNAFEFFGPLLELTKKLVPPFPGPPTQKPDTEDAKYSQQKIQLLLSSEWGYSPFNRLKVPELPNFVFIGMPATESSNPFIIPLAGHEIGHSVWNRSEDLLIQFRKKSLPRLAKIILDKWPPPLKDFESKIKPKIAANSNPLDDPEIYQLVDLVYRKYFFFHAAETFCDFLGLRIFGKSYLYAFAFWISPNFRAERPLIYPPMLTRVQNLLRAAKRYGVTPPKNFLQMFNEFSSPLVNQETNYCIEISDIALKETVGDLIKMVDNLAKQKEIPSASEKEAKRIYTRFLQISPAEKCHCMADILNAAWKAFEKERLWQQYIKLEKEPNPERKRRQKVYKILKDLVLKNIEVFEVERVQMHKEKADA